VKPSPVRTSADLHLSHSWLCSKAYEGLCKHSHISSPLVPSPLVSFKVNFNGVLNIQIFFFSKFGFNLICHNFMRSIILKSVLQSHRIVTHQFGTKFWNKKCWDVLWCVWVWKIIFILFGFFLKPAHSQKCPNFDSNSIPI
jgi:hypothetical protein